jgi:undecaprenyl phosphate N,N'-diacetylbacillosamine 1-phosphate transferase
MKEVIYITLKRLTDITVSFVGLIVLAPIMLIIAILVRATSSGPALYRARRMGKNQKDFYQLKYRTMVENAEDLRNADGSTLSAKDDPRLTKVGRILRSTSLDEIPQLWNVLAGAMSLVGPRPDPINVQDLYRPEDYERLSVKPGITGWAIVHGRNRIPWVQRRDLDLEYIRIRSYWLDIKILFLTVRMVIFRTGVHAPSNEDYS